MTILPFLKLACPLDGKSLTRDGTSWKCAKGHNFDTAKKGYINLLPVQNKRSLDPGDHKEMVAARQRFLNAGFYHPIADAVQKKFVSIFPGSPGETLNCLDAGCGEGYYLRGLVSTNIQHNMALIGLDISKWAVMAAARQNSLPTWVVGSNARLPVQSNTLDCVLSVFGFPVYQEFSRVLKTDGVLLTVEAGADHLRELREIIYPSQKPARDARNSVPQGFSNMSSSTLKFSLQLGNAAHIADLFSMTPHFYRANAEGREKVASLGKLNVTVEVLLRQYQCASENRHQDATASTAQ